VGRDAIAKDSELLFLTSESNVTEEGTRSGGEPDDE